MQGVFFKTPETLSSQVEVKITENNNTSYVISLEKARNTTHITLFFRENSYSDKKFRRFNFLKKLEYGIIFLISQLPQGVAEMLHSNA